MPIITHIYEFPYLVPISTVYSQANETGSSQATELLRNYLQQLGLSIAPFVSDRQKGIAKWIRENYDIWHIARWLVQVN